MSSPRPLPEAVRGCWYYLDADAPLDTEEPQFLCFSVDGTFRRYQAKRNSRKLAENGDYTFDGNFLILRGRRTQTFRVRRPQFWNWYLEGKKNSYRLLRARFDAESYTPLSDDERRDIRMLPLRARIEADYDGDDVIYRVVYDTDDSQQRLLATLFVESDGPQWWIGLTPLADGIGIRTWERIIRESFLDVFLDAPENVSTVTLLLLDSGQPATFTYDRS